MNGQEKPEKSKYSKTEISEPYKNQSQIQIEELYKWRFKQRLIDISTKRKP